MSAEKSWGPRPDPERGPGLFYNNMIKKEKTFTKSLIFPPNYETIDYQTRRR
jgi:hypothetical protein